MSGFDVAVAGGGLVGASLALALAGTGRRVVLIEAVAHDSAAQPSFDERTTALGNASRRILSALGVWERAAAQAGVIRTIHVSDAGRFGFARLSAAEQGIEAFGYVVPNRVLGAALWARVAASPHISVRVPAQVQSLTAGAAGVDIALAGGERLSAALAVGADGAASAVRRASGIGATVRDYHQVAVVANVATDVAHADTAYERFTGAGPMALVPLADGSYTVVWALAPAQAERCLQLPQAQFLQELQRHFGWRAGRFIRAGRRAGYPLALTRAEDTPGERMVLIGNASQSLHPVAGQGFNLGLRDAAALAEQLAAPGDPGDAQRLQAFAEWRAADRRGVTGFTDALVRLFGDRRPAVGAVRDLGLLLFDLLPPAKSALARVSAGFGGRSPRLARGLPLT
ncbi:MAG TPA: 2-octaprenyl-6-methoxyphenyl hydroxylase [Steroidobacteraceae bacterium]|nr:2-octaprenyl-6-methoxyphenyl hydroxylase [Steroidobacteraceae bacterium]